MKLAVKTLKGDLFHIEADGTDTVLVLKEKIAILYEEYPADRQKLIHGGKVLKDTETVAEKGLTEADFLVIMISKPAPAPKPVAVPTPAPAPVPAAGNRNFILKYLFNYAFLTSSSVNSSTCSTSNNCTNICRSSTKSNGYGISRGRS